MEIKNRGTFEHHIFYTLVWLGDCVSFLTWQEVALSIQDFLDVSDPDLLDVDVGSLQGEALRRAATQQHKLTGIVIRTLRQTQEGYL